MKDSIILGTGNSRYLKSVENFKALYPTYDDFAAALVDGTLPVDFNGINPAGFQQVGDSLNSENLLKVATAALYGLPDTAVPDEVLALLKSLVNNAQTSADGKAKIQTGSYIGTGTYGSANPCSLIFESIPKFVYIKSFDSSYAGFFLPFTLTDSFTWFAYHGFTENAGLQSANLSAKFKNLTLSWYSAGAYKDAKYQLNTSEKKYCYIAII